MRKYLIIGAAALSFTGVALAESADPVEMASAVGFTGCNELIKNTFNGAMKARERRFSIDYFPETKNEAITLTTTFGSTGDTVYQTATFIKKKGVCYSHVNSFISTQANCAGLLANDRYFKYQSDSAGAVWAKNVGGVTKIFIQSGSTCIQTFKLSDKLSSK